MKRRQFLRSSLLASGTAFLSSGTAQASPPPAEKPFRLLFAPHDGMFTNSAGKDIIDQIRFAHDMGFRAIEDNGMMSRSPAEQARIGETLASLG